MDAGSDDHDSEDAETVDEDIEIENEGSELCSERAQTTRYLLQDIVTNSEVEDMIATEIEKSTSLCNAPVLVGVVEEKLVEMRQVGYDDVKGVRIFCLTW